MSFQAQAKSFIDAEKMAAAYLSQYFKNQKVSYPINPFQMLKDEGVLFSFMNSLKLEGVYVPASDETDIPLVGINVNRPITRQRFTAAHELCHHFRDADKQITCPISGKKDEIEQFADKFAAAILMPLTELRAQVNKRKNAKGHVSLDAVLEIADYFGVSFESCLRRIAYRIHAIEGDTENTSLKKLITKYCPDKKRKARHMTHAALYAELIDCCQEQLAFRPTEFARNVFQNNYIYNDSRMEGLDVSQDEAAEIVTDIRLNMQNSDYCAEENEAFLSIAGHYDMYQEIFAEPVKDTLNVYEAIILNKKLFSHYPFPEFGGRTRQNNTLVLGAKFETVDWHDIFTELEKINQEVQDSFSKRKEMPMSEYIKHVARTHHRITVVHPFSEGNGRTSRAFMNMQLVRAGMMPIYIRVADKQEYIDALAYADKTSDYEELYEIVFRLMLRSLVELTKQQ